MRFLFSILFLLSAELLPQVITVVDSSTGLPVANVNVVSKGNNSFAVTGEQGKFSLERFNKNDSLVVSHISYKTLTLSFNEVQLNKIIHLSPSSIEQETIEITEKKYDNSGVISKEKITIDSELKESYTNVGDILKTSSSLFIKDYGGFSGLKAVSSRGMSSENTIVLFNEARVNDLQTGLFDLSLISSRSIASIEFLKSADDASFYSAAGGVLKIFTPQSFEGRKINSSLRLSSDKYQSAFIHYTDGNDNLFFNINAERNYSPNHFNFSFEDKDLERENAQFSKLFLSGDVSFIHNKFFINVYSNYSYLNSGIPGFVVTNNYNSSRATNKSSRNLSVLNSKYSFNDNFSLSGIISYNNQSLLLYDPDGFLVNSNNDKESKLSDFSAMIRANLNYVDFNFSLGNEFNSSSMENFTSFVSSNLIPNYMERFSNKIFSGIQTRFINPFLFFNNISLLGKINYELTEEEIGREIKSNNFSYDLGISIIPVTEPFINVKTHYSRIIRFPTFNERYYSNLYSHYDLIPEKYNVFDAGVDIAFNFFGETTFSAEYFLITGNNKIMWIPTRLALQTPRNISKVNTAGIELKLNKKTLDDILAFTFFYIYTDAKNKSGISENDLSYNKQLIYTPLHRFNFNLSAKVNPFTFAVFSSLVSERFYTTDNNPLYVLPEYYVVDFSATYNFKLFKRSHSLALTTYNLFNESYFVIQSYPMPLRTFLLTINMEIL